MSVALTDSERTALVERHIDLVRRVARAVLPDQPRWVRHDDLVGAGQLGLLDAARRFDPERGVPFVTYAHYRVRGAMLDHVRKVAIHDPITRLRAAAQSAVDDLMGSVIGDQNPDALSAEGAASLLASALQEAATAFALSELAVEAHAPPPEDPETAATRTETGERLVEAIDALPERERGILRGVYIDGKTIEQSGAAQGLTKGWSSRLHARALSLLRESLAGLEPHLGVEE